MKTETDSIRIMDRFSVHLVRVIKNLNHKFGEI